jgi:hypothetical protein
MLEDSMDWLNRVFFSPSPHPNRAVIARVSVLTKIFEYGDYGNPLFSREKQIFGWFFTEKLK